jgi:hypothetical protein
VSHVYEYSGTFVVTLQVTDVAGNVATDSLTVTVVVPQVSASRIVIGAGLAVLLIVVAVLAARRRKRRLLTLETDS